MPHIHSDVPLTEPDIINCLYMTGIEIDIDDDGVRLVGWTYLPKLGDDPAERRIVMRAGHVSQ